MSIKETCKAVALLTQAPLVNDTARNTGDIRSVSVSQTQLKKIRIIIKAYFTQSGLQNVLGISHTKVYWQILKANLHNELCQSWCSTHYKYVSCNH
jgi:hypothetical protein